MEPNRPRMFGDEHSLTLSFTRFNGRGRASDGESLQYTANVQHGFVLAETGEPHGEKTEYVKQIMTNQCFLTTEILHRNAHYQSPKERSTHGNSSYTESVLLSDGNPGEPHPLDVPMQK